MSMLAEAYTTKELARVLGVTPQSVLRYANNENWEPTPRSGRGGGSLWTVSHMSPDIRDRLASAMLRQSLPDAPFSCLETSKAQSIPTHASVVPALQTSLARASEKERAVALARLAFVREVDRLTGVTGKEKAIRHILDAAQFGHLPEHLAALADIANACKRGAGSTLSRRTLYRWCTDYADGGEVALLPSYRKPEPAPDWAEDFMRHYAKPQHPTVALAYKDFFDECVRQGKAARSIPSIHAVRRLLRKMALPEREAGRATGNALLKLRPYKRRDTSELWPTDVYTADGTTFDAEVIHPYNGQPFKPELTAVLDIATRRCVGLSINLSESALTVLDALRMACCFGGVPAMFYSDNGPGYINTMMKDDNTGIFQRLGITATASIPGRPQGKGLMERAVKTLWVEAAQGLKSYTGAMMDGDAGHRSFKLSRAALKSGKRSHLPTWGEFKTHVLHRVERYNATPHRSLPKFTDASGRRRHYSPDEYWQTFVERGFTPVVVPEAIREELFMPSERRQVRNGWVQFYSGNYYSEELTDFHKDYVEVRYDVWDSSRVYVWTLKGRKICTARLDGNSIPYFPQTRIEAARDRREKAQVNRIDAKLQRIAPGAQIVLPETPGLADSTQAIPASQAAMAALESRPETLPLAETRPTLFLSTYEHYRWCMSHRNACTHEDDAWMAAYVAGEEYAEMHELYAAEGIEWRTM